MRAGRLPSARPRSFFRRVERWGVGIALGIVAFLLEKAVARSIRKGQTKPKPVRTEPIATSSGPDVQAKPPS